MGYIKQGVSIRRKKGVWKFGVKMFYNPKADKRRDPPTAHEDKGS